ncbi:hypothetical protein [Nocardia wallacei]|uniref:hypothetical protein n=1 Tax=Nocardia wallacei TaxID=480035 RepID=UPI002453E7B8|nr:hypothetical protein [Nocardia wallacei]
MKLDDGCRIEYIIWSEAWFADASPSEFPRINIISAAEGGGVDWEFNVIERQLDGWTTQVLVFADAYNAFVDIPEFFAAMAETQPRFLHEVIAILDEMGAVDGTPRVNPHARIS